MAVQLVRTKKKEVRKATATLTELDIIEAGLSAEPARDYIGTTLTVDKNLDMKTKINLMGLGSMATRETSLGEQYDIFKAFLPSLAANILEWNLADESGEKVLPITGNTLATLPEEAFMAVQMVFGKAHKEGALDPNSKAS